MSEHPPSFTPPRSILLATDLTSRGDRALGRAAMLSREWDAALHIAHVVEAAPPVPLGVDPVEYRQRHPDPREDALRTIRRDIGAEELGATVHIEEDATPASAILALAERVGAELIVLGESRPRLLGPIVESTTEHLMRRAPVSVLIVRDRPRLPYRHVLVGTDFTDEAQQALVIAALLFPDAAITLMHAFSMPYASLLEATPEDSGLAEQRRAKLRAQIDAAPLAAERRASIRNAVDVGHPGATLRRYVVEQGADLSVIGAHARGMLFDTVVGNSRRIVDAIPGDILMVRATRTPLPASS